MWLWDVNHCAPACFFRSARQHNCLINRFCGRNCLRASLRQNVDWARCQPRLQPHAHRQPFYCHDQRKRQLAAALGGLWQSGSLAASTAGSVLHAAKEGNNNIFVKTQSQNTSQLPVSASSGSSADAIDAGRSPVCAWLVTSFQAGHIVRRSASAAIPRSTYSPLGAQFPPGAVGFSMPSAICFTPPRPCASLWLYMLPSASCMHCFNVRFFGPRFCASATSHRQTRNSRA